MGTKFAVAGSNLVVAYEEIECLHYLNNGIHKISLTFHTLLRFLDDVFDIELFYI